MTDADHDPGDEDDAEALLAARRREDDAHQRGLRQRAATVDGVRVVVPVRP